MRPWFAFRTATTARFRRACSSTAAPIAPAWPSRYGTAIVRIRVPYDGAERRGRRHPPEGGPVVLTTPEEVETWMTAPPDEALKLQRPLQDGSIKIVARGVKEDTAGTAT